MNCAFHRSLLALALLVTSPGFVLARHGFNPSPAPSPAPATTAAEAAAEVRARALFTEVSGPFCPGLPLADCPSPNAFTMRGDIERRLKNGESRQAIVDELVKTYQRPDPGGPIGHADRLDRVASRSRVGAAAAAGLAFFLRRATRSRSEKGSDRHARGVARVRGRVGEELAALD